MSDENDQQERPEDDAHIRALLAELGSGPAGESMPPDVAARLDDTLARLVAERAAGGVAGDDDTVVPLRRRWVPRLTAAAAAVIVLGAGGVAASNLGVFGGSSSDSASSSDAGGSSAAKSEARSASPSDPDATARRDAERAQALPKVRSTAFASDVGSLVRLSRAGAVAPLTSDQKASGGSESEAGGDTASRSPAAALGALRCPGPEITDDAVPSPITYDGRVAVLVVHPPRDGKQLVEAWDCQGTRTLDSATLTP